VWMRRLSQFFFPVASLVVGDDGEKYTSPDSHGILPAVCRSGTPPITKPWWRFW